MTKISETEMQDYERIFTSCTIDIRFLEKFRTNYIQFQYQCDIELLTVLGMTN